MSRWKIFNFRPLLFVFAMLVVGIFSANYISSSFALSITLLLTVLALLVFYSINLKKFFILMVGVISIFIGISGFYFEKKINAPSNINLTNQTITGTIDKYYTHGGGASIYVSNIKANGNKIDGNCSVEFSNFEGTINFKVGDKIAFLAESFSNLTLYEDIPNASLIKNNLKYSVTTSEIVVYGKLTDLKTILQQKIHNNLEKGLSSDKANLMYSCLFGDKSELNSSVQHSFSISGVAHLLAVSGLHVGIIVAVLMFVLKLFKCNKFARFIIILLFLSFYCYLCGGAASIVRATVMTVVLLGAPLCFSEYDTLSSISLAGVIILLIKPSSLFDVSFLLSFMCVFGICFFYPHGQAILNKLHFNNIFSQAFIISVITNISTLFIMLYYFKEINFIGIVANIFILPIFTFVFSATFVIVLVSLIMPFLSYLLVMISPLINIVIVLSNFFASIGHYITANSVSFTSILLYSILLFTISKYNLKSVVGKSICINVVTLLLITEIILTVKQII